MKLTIPNYDDFEIKNIVFDFNGTLAAGGVIPEKVLAELDSLAKKLNVYVLTSDTFGTVGSTFAETSIKIAIMDGRDDTAAKQDFIEKLNSEQTIAVGNGNNDSLMLKTAALGIALIGPEGAAIPTLMNSDIAVTSIEDVFNLINDPIRLTATLRR
ncbi:MAG: HAD family hydrolase [Bacillota bacterium]